jgi:hypothetical protein
VVKGGARFSYAAKWYCTTTPSGDVPRECLAYGQVCSSNPRVSRMYLEGGRDKDPLGSRGSAGRLSVVW